jgi:hypothetical protein
LVGSLPFGSTALYPFSLFVTLLHEFSHAVAAIVTGGSVQSISISSDTSGVTVTLGGTESLIAPAGYLGATLFGVGLLLAPLRWARAALASLAAVPLATLIFLHPATSFTAIWCVGFAAALGAAAWKLRPRLLGFLQVLLGVEAGLNAFRDLMTLLFISGSGAHIHTDAVNMSRALFGPPLMWAVMWTVVSVAFLSLAVWKVARSDLSALSGRASVGGETAACAQ